MDNKIKLVEGMGVVNATIEQQKAVITVAKAYGLKIFTGTTLAMDSEIRPAVFSSGFIQSGGSNAVQHPVTFAEFIQAILNEPEKVKEVVVKMVQSDGMGLDALVTKDGLKLNGFLFPLSVIDSLAAAKKEVEG